MAKVNPRTKAKLDKEARKGPNFIRPGELAAGKPEVFRMVPFDPEEGPWRKVGKYWLKDWAEKGGIDLGNVEELTEKTVFFDPTETFGRKCKLSSKIMKLMQSEDQEDQALAKAMKPKASWYIKVVKRSEVAKMGAKAPVYVLEANYSIFKELDRVFRVDEEDISHPTEGSDFRVLKEGKGQFGTTYGVRILGTSPLSKKSKVIKALIQKAGAIDMNSLIRDDTAVLDEIHDAIFPDSAKKPGKKKKTKRKDDDEDEIEEEEEETEDEESEDEDEDEGDEESEDEEGDEGDDESEDEDEDSGDEDDEDEDEGDDESEDDEEESDEDDEDGDDDDDDDDDDDEESEDDEDDEDGDDDEESEDEDDDEDSGKKVKKKVSGGKKPAGKSKSGRTPPKRRK